MTVYRYKAIASGGEVLEGQMEAASEDAVIARLSDLGHFPVRAERLGTASPAGRTRISFRRRMSRGELAIATRELSRLLAAGITLERSLQILGSISQAPPVEACLARLLERLRGGQSFADAVEAEGAPFDRVYVNIVRAGEAGAALPDVLARLSDYMARSREMQAQVVSAMIYPALLLGVAALSLMLLLTLVVPQFEQLFASAHATLPAPTRVVIGVARWTRDWWFVPLIVLLCILVLAPRLYRVPVLRRAWDAMLLALPVVGPAIRKIETARFCRTLASLLANDVPLLAALTVVRETVNNAVIAAALGEVAERLRSGEGIARPLAELRVLPDMAVHMIGVGEETARLDSMLADVGDIFDAEVAQTLKRLLALVEPILILSLGTLIGGIIVSILLAVLEVNKLAV